MLKNCGTKIFIYVKQYFARPPLTTTLRAASCTIYCCTKVRSLDAGSAHQPLWLQSKFATAGSATSCNNKRRNYNTVHLRLKARQPLKIVEESLNRALLKCSTRKLHRKQCHQTCANKWRTVHIREIVEIRKNAAEIVDYNAIVATACVVHQTKSKKKRLCEIIGGNEACNLCPLLAVPDGNSHTAVKSRQPTAITAT